MSSYVDLQCVPITTYFSPLIRPPFEGLIKWGLLHISKIIAFIVSFIGGVNKSTQ
jgi:hypothetical protein